MFPFWLDHLVWCSFSPQFTWDFRGLIRLALSQSVKDDRLSIRKECLTGESSEGHKFSWSAIKCYFVSIAARWLFILRLRKIVTICYNDFLMVFVYCLYDLNHSVVFTDIWFSSITPCGNDLMKPKNLDRNFKRKTQCIKFHLDLRLIQLGLDQA